MGFAKGSQDWGGRRPLNPDNCPHVSGEDVRKFAHSYSISVKREGYGMWWYKPRHSDSWLTLGQTNYLALSLLKRHIKEEYK
jgi:hypothetical protein